MKKALMIRIESAGIYPDPRDSHTTDKIFDGKGKTNRYDKKTKSAAPYISVSPDTFSVKHVANLLRVFFGQRPVPSLRKTQLKADPFYEELARKARVRIEESSEETVTQTKSVKDSWNPAKVLYDINGTTVSKRGGLMYWDRIKRFLGEDLYLGMRKVLVELGAPKNLTGTEAIEFLNKHKTNESVKNFSVACSKNGRSSMVDLINNEKDTSTVHTGTGSKLNYLLAGRNVEQIRKVSGIIAVPMTEEQIGKLSDGSGVATFLEGGLAYIEDIEDWSELIVSDTVPVEEGKYVSNSIAPKQ